MFIKNSEALIEVQHPEDMVGSLGLGLATNEAIDQPGDHGLAMELAWAEVDEVVKKAVGEDIFDNIQESMENSSIYQEAEKSLLQKIRRSRIAMIGFGALAAFSLVKSAQHFVSSDFNIFSSPVPSSLTSIGVQECYDDPAGTQLIIENIWRETEPSDNDSVVDCLLALADDMDSALQESRNDKAVRPFADDVEVVIEDVRILADDPGAVASEEVVEGQDAVQEAIRGNEDHLLDETAASAGFFVLMCLSYMPADFNKDIYRRRKQAVDLLRELTAYKHEDVVAALDADVHGDYSEPPVHKLTHIGLGDQKEVVLLPGPGVGESITGKNLKRWSILFELHNALRVQKEVQA